MLETPDAAGQPDETRTADLRSRHVPTGVVHDSDPGGTAISSRGQAHDDAVEAARQEYLRAGTLARGDAIGGTPATDAKADEPAPGSDPSDDVNYVDTADPHDAAIYAAIRGNPEDTSRISENTGIPRDIVDQIKDHVFVSEHEVPLGPGETVIGHFVPDSDIADLWPKAEAGALTPEEGQRFGRLMAHEYVESSLMNSGLPYRSADPSAWDADNVNRPTPEHHGAHDLAPRVDPNRDPFGHWPISLGRAHPGVVEISPTLANLDPIIQSILGKGA